MPFPGAATARGRAAPTSSWVLAPCQNADKWRSPSSTMSSVARIVMSSWSERHRPGSKSSVAAVSHRLCHCSPPRKPVNRRSNQCRTADDPAARIFRYISTPDLLASGGRA
eukprot:6893510-Pyramimonas_sp.AAC.1